ncbi:endothelin-converting enzyme 2-like [Ixodes scapularis]|uniref:endothelin-converting enzyme 2-like n=1 Tax=Ixodes scapularis TaxID=6945 RepID=UPI001A9F1A8C|nr:endothelin-converting enzyme 2-like [Ixodes scapularis]
MQEWKKRTTAVIVLVAFSVFVTFAVLWLSMGSRAKLFRTVALSWCTADSCLEHAARLTESMDRTVQPCQDFYAYVCGKWKPYADETYISDVAGRMRASLLRANSIILYNGSSRQSSFKKVSATFKSCIERKSEDQASNIKKLKKFMFARGIPWPQDPPEDRHPLDVLLDLDINWGIPVLFKTRLFSNPLVAVVVRSNSLTDVILGDKKLREYFEEGSVKKRMSAFYSIYTGETPSVGKLQRAQGIYVNIIQKAKIAIVDAEGFVRTNISDLQGPTSAISNSTNTWLALLKKHFRIYNTSNLNGSTEVVTNNVKLSAVVNELIETYAWKDILSAIGFWFVELYTSVAEDQLLKITFGSTATKMLQVVCYYQIEQRYGSAAMLTGYITNRFKMNNQDRVNDLLADLKYHVLAVLQKDQTEGVIHKVRSIRFRLWPSSSLENSLKKAFPSIQHAYIDFWTNTSASAGSSLGLPLYDDLYGLPGFLDPFVEYRPLDNILTISLNALSSPLYYNDGTRAIIYGGLGWQVARAIFKSTEGRACKKACSDSHGLEASFAAYKASLSISESRALSIFDSPVKAGKVFFLSLVRGTCGTSGKHINAMLKKFPPFAKIYGCAATGKSRR